jgi:hypothetical protein
LGVRPPPGQPWLCPQCGQLNDGSVTGCKSCRVTLVSEADAARRPRGPRSLDQPLAGCGGVTLILLTIGAILVVAFR